MDTIWFLKSLFIMFYGALSWACFIHGMNGWYGDDD